MRRSAAYAAAAAWVALLWTLSSSSLGDGALDFAWRFAHDDKLVHAGLYAVLGALLRIATGGVAPAVAGGLLAGAIDETIQSRVPGRHADPWDLLADVVGTALGALLAGAATGVRPAPRRPRGPR